MLRKILMFFRTGPGVRHYDEIRMDPKSWDQIDEFVEACARRWPSRSR